MQGVRAYQRLGRFSRVSLLSICAISTGVICYLYNQTFVEGSPFLLTVKKVEYQIRDWQARFGRKTKKDADLVYLAADEQSITLSVLGAEEIAASPTLSLIKQNGFPYHRKVYADILERLSLAGAKLVIFDFLFVNPREGDKEFHDALEKYAKQVIVGWDIQIANDYVGRITLLTPHVGLLLGEDMSDNRLGGVHHELDEDDVFRRAIFNQRFSPNGAILHSIAAQAMRKINRQDLVPPGFDGLLFRWTGKGYSHMTSGHGFRPLPIYEIFDPKIWKTKYKNGEFFKNKIVIVGPDGTYHHDEHETPFGKMAGPEIHLNVINAVREGEFIRETGATTNYCLIAAFGFVAWVVMSAIRAPVAGGVFFLGLNILYVAIAQIFFNHQGLYVLMFLPLLNLDACAMLGLVNEYLAERKEKSRVRSTLERYVSKNVVREVLDNPDTYFNRLGGVRLPVTVLFSDVRDFTSMTESGDATELVTQLNEYLEEMTRAVFENSGTLDKFIGDAVMAVWGNVQTRGQKQDALSAVESALLMRQSLKKLNEGWEAKGLKRWAFGIGINQGEAIAGNVGSHEKMDPTVIGDPVNLASRLEGLTKKYHTDLIISGSVAQHLEDVYYLQKIDVVRAKGKSKPVDLYMVWGRKSEPMEDSMKDYLQKFNVALDMYHQRKFAEARRAFTLAAVAKPQDYLTQLYQERCEFFRGNPPGDEWDGVYVFTEK